MQIYATAEWLLCWFDVCLNGKNSYKKEVALNNQNDDVEVTQTEILETINRLNFDGSHNVYMNDALLLLMLLILKHFVAKLFRIDITHSISIARNL